MRFKIVKANAVLTRVSHQWKLFKRDAETLRLWIQTS
jgi:hypothetical protein